MPIHLSEIQTPQELHFCSFDELKQLSQEIRSYIIDVMKENGGHLASNLGMVELTLAMHHVFSSPTDHFLFDVSHQTYTHKLLTGRYKKFPSIRKYQGLSGFASPQESEHDLFFSGHAGTALAQALALARTRKAGFELEDTHVLCVLNDASLSCGLTLEAMNHVSSTLKNFIIILNDNGMSISHPTGNLAEMLQTKDTETLSKFFSCYHLKYQGPFDGHDIEQMSLTLKNNRNKNFPTILHVKTLKGKGFPPAELCPETWHGAQPIHFAPSPTQAHTQENKPKKSTFPKIFGQHILSQASLGENIFAITPAMSIGSCLEEFQRKFPSQFFDAGIAESFAVTFAGALAKKSGYKVVCSIYATFLQRSLDNVFQDVALQESPVIFAIDRSGFSTGDGVTHHGIYDLAFLFALPQVIICQPRNGKMLQLLLNMAFTGLGRAIFIRYPNLPTTMEEVTPPHLGRGEVLLLGQEVLIVSLGHMYETAKELAQLLNSIGITPTILDPVFIKPFDEELLLDLLPTHHKIITIEEHVVNTGLGMIISTICTKHQQHHVSIQSFGVPDKFIQQGAYSELLKESCITAEHIFQSVKHDFVEVCV